MFKAAWRCMPRLCQLVAVSVMSTPTPVPLNVSLAAEEAAESTASPAEVASSLQKQMLRLKGTFMEDDGSGVNYVAFAASQEFVDYCQSASRLQTLNLSGLTEDEALAFWINVYNALTIHGLVAASKDGVAPKSVLDIPQFWGATAYSVCGFVFSLDDIEHGVIRGNRAHPGSKKQFFAANDPRLQFTLHNFDPRIHFALVCGAKSCPPIRVFSHENLNHGLELAARGFIQQEVNIEGKKVRMSRIFLWYMPDFVASKNDLLRWCADQLQDGALKQQLEALSSDPGVSISFADYNWQLNSSH